MLVNSSLPAVRLEPTDINSPYWQYTSKLDQSTSQHSFNRPSRASPSCLFGEVRVQTGRYRGRCRCRCCRRRWRHSGEARREDGTPSHRSRLSSTDVLTPTHATHTRVRTNTSNNYEAHTRTRTTRDNFSRLTKYFFPVNIIFFRRACDENKTSKEDQ